MYQYIMNVNDEDIKSLLYRLTFHSEDEINSVMAGHKRSPELRIGQKFLASSIVKMIHGKEAAQLCEMSTDAFF